MAGFFFEPEERWLTEGMRSLSRDYGYGFSPYGYFDPEAARILHLSPYPSYYPYPQYHYERYPIHNVRKPRKNINLSANKQNNFFIDNAYFNVEDGYWNEHRQMWRSYLRGLWSPEKDYEPGNMVFKRYRNNYFYNL